MKILGFWLVMLGVCILGIVGITKIDDFEYVIREKSLWFHVPAFLLCLYTVINSGIIIFNKFYG